MLTLISLPPLPLIHLGYLSKKIPDFHGTLKQHPAEQPWRMLCYCYKRIVQTKRTIRTFSCPLFGHWPSPSSFDGRFWQANPDGGGCSSAIGWNTTYPCIGVNSTHACRREINSQSSYPITHGTKMRLRLSTASPKAQEEANRRLR